MTKRRLSWTIGVVVAAILAILLVATPRRPAAEAGHPASLPIRIAIGADIRGTNPGVTRDGNTDAILHHVVESLVAYRENLEVAPLLAERVEVSPDHATYRFILREGLRFHNGAPVTSAEVKWSWERMLDPRTGFLCRIWYDGSLDTGFGSKITSIATPDPRTVVFTLDRPNSSFLDQLASLQCITAILHPDSVGKDGKWREPIGTGPYRIRQWRRGEYVDLERFKGYAVRAEPGDGYAGGRIARAPRLRFVIIPEISVGLSAIQAGDIDILPRVPPNLIAHMNIRGSGIKVESSEQLAWHTLLIQTRDPLLKDVSMRRAIAKAINLSQLAAIATYGSVPANPSAVPKISPFHSAPQELWWSYDPRGVGALLAKAGYRGQPIWIQTNRKTPFTFDNAVAIQAMLIAAGLDARLEVIDWATQLSNYLKGEFQLSVFSYSARAHPVLNYAAFVGSKEKNPQVQWDDPTARRLLRAATEARSPAQQQAIFDRLHRLMARDVPIIGLYNEPSNDLVRSDIRGFRTWPIGHPRLWGVWREGI